MTDSIQREPLTNEQWQIVCEQINAAAELAEPLFILNPTRAVARHWTRKAPKQDESD